MNAYTRTTRECTFEDMHPDLATAIRKHLEMNKMEVGESSDLICFETSSTRQKTGLLTNSDEVTITGVLITPQLLVWTNGKKEGKAVVTLALLRNIDAHDFENSARYKVIPDSGINITGRYTDGTKERKSFIGLGSDPAGEKFRQALQLAIQKAHP